MSHEPLSPPAAFAGGSQTKMKMKMKMKMKRQESTTGLPRFIVGALATAGASAANGAIVQITFEDSYILGTGINFLDVDFGNDGQMDMIGFNPATNVAVLGVPGFGLGAYAQIQSVGSDGVRLKAKVGENAFLSTAPAQDFNGVRDLISFSFSDANIRGGQWTTGYLDITAGGGLADGVGIYVNRLIFNPETGGDIEELTANATTFTEYDISAVPEPSTSLYLLAMGAGGLLTRRRRAA